MSDLKIQIVGTLNTSLTLEDLNKKIKGLESKLSSIKLKVDIDDNFTKTIQSFKSSMDKFKSSADSLTKSITEEETVFKKLDGTVEKVNRKYLQSGEIIQKTTKIIDEKKKALDAETLAIKDQTKALERQGEVQKKVTKTNAVGKQVAQSVTTKNNGNNTTYNYDQNRNLKSTTIVEDFAKQQKQVENLNASLFRLYNQGKLTADQFNKFSTSINNAKNIDEVKKLTQELNQQSQTTRNLEAQNKLLNDVNTLSRTHTKTVDHKNLDELRNSITGISPASITAANTLANLNAEFTRVKAGAKEAARSSMGFGDMMEQAFTKFPIWMIASTAFFLPLQGIQDMTTRVIELDTQMTNLKRVMDGEDFQFNNLLEDSIDLTDKLSGRLTDVLKLVEEFGRMGNSMDESLALAETAQILQNISDLDAKQSVDALTSAMINFGIAAEDSMQIANKLNEVDNNYSVTTLDLSQSLSKASSTAKTFGVSLEDLIGQTTSIAAATRESGNIVGNSLKSIYARIGNNDSSISALNEIGISVKDAAGETKSAQALIEETARAWDTLSSSQKQNTSIGVAGIYQLSR